MQITLDSEDLRYIIQNAGKIKKDGKCIHCKGTGWINWNCEDGGDVKAGTNYDDNTRDNDECNECEGVGYVW